MNKATRAALAAIGRIGGRRRMANLTAAQRKALSAKAIAERWRRYRLVQAAQKGPFLPPETPGEGSGKGKPRNGRLAPKPGHGGAVPAGTPGT